MPAAPPGPFPPLQWGVCVCGEGASRHAVSPPEVRAGSRHWRGPRCLDRAFGNRACWPPMAKFIVGGRRSVMRSGLGLLAVAIRVIPTC